MKRALVLALALGLGGCGGGDQSAGAEATLAPTTIIKDALLLAAVKAKLAGEDIDSTTRVRVSVHDGAVTLSGKVGSESERSRALESAKAMSGVKAVEDRMSVGAVGPGAVKQTGNLAVVAGVEAAIAAQAGVNVSSVRVAANDGVVTLTGTAPTAAVKSTVIAAARSAPGVRNVVEKIAVK